jgi:hypothetical protein
MSSKVKHAQFVKWYCDQTYISRNFSVPKPPAEILMQQQVRQTVYSVLTEIAYKRDYVQLDID